MKTSKYLIFLVMLGWLMVSCDEAIKINLVENGKPKAVIVIPVKPSETVKFASSELQDYVLKISGAKLPIVNSASFQHDSFPGQLPIFVGHFPSQVTQIAKPEFKYEGWLVATNPNGIILYGKDENVLDHGRELTNPLISLNKVGSLFAVYQFLHDHLGVRWLWPGKSGEVYTPRKTIQVPGNLYVKKEPKVYIMRHIRNNLENRGLMKALVKKYHLDQKKIAAMKKEWSLWYRRHFLGRPYKTGGGHSFNHWYKKYAKQHPDWLCMNPCGERFSPLPGRKVRGHDFKICSSNPQVVDQVYHQICEEIKRRPDRIAAAASPNDGGNFCMCPNCKKLDHPDGKRIIMKFLTRKKGEIKINHVSLTNRYCVLWNELADRLKKDYPDKFIEGDAYSYHRSPPVDISMRKNILIRFVGFDYLNDQRNDDDWKSWNGWSKAGAKLMLRPNYIAQYYGLPTLFANRMGEDIKKCAAGPMAAADFDTWHNDWALNGLNVYLLAELLVNPERDIDEITDEYCQAFGKAAPAIKDFIRLSEKFTENYATNPVKGFKYDAQGRINRTRAYYELGKRFSPEYLNNLEKCLNRASSLTADKDVLSRIEFMKQGLRYARIQRDCLVSMGEVSINGKDANSLLKSVAAKIDFYNTNWYNWSVGVLFHKSLIGCDGSRKRKGYFGDNFYHLFKGKKIVKVLARWQFKTDPDNSGLTKGWQKSDFNDSAWKTLLSGQWWESQGVKEYNGYAWYRCQLKLPPADSGKKLKLIFGGIDDMGWVYINGKLVYDGKKENEKYTDPVIIEINKKMLVNHNLSIAVKVSDQAGAGGLWKPVVICSE